MSQEIKVMLEGLVTFLVTNGIKALAKQFGWNIEGKMAVLVVALVGAAVLLADAAWELIPVEYQPVAGSVLSLIVVLLTAAGIYKTRQM